MNQKDYIIVATRNGILRLEDRNGEWVESHRFAEMNDIRSVAVQGENVLAGGQAGMFRSDDGGRHWTQADDGLAVPYVRWIAFHPDGNGRAFAGTEPASIFLSVDGGATWCERPEVARLRDRHGWSLPYSPRAGCVRGFAAQGDRVYAAVEQGGLLRSDDRGESWRFVNGTCRGPGEQPDDKTLHADVHSVVVHPSSPDLVFAPTGGGFYRSRDGGMTWEFLYDCYCRACWVDSTDPQHIVLGPADGVSRNGRIEESRDGGQSWTEVSQPLATPWPEDMIERFVSQGNSPIAVCSDGRLFRSNVDTARWEPFLPAISNARMAIFGPNAVN